MACFSFRSVTRKKRAHGKENKHRDKSKNIEL